MTMTFKEALIAHLQGEKVEAKGLDGVWRSMRDATSELPMAVIYLQDSAFSKCEFRLAPRTIMVNGVEVPAPESVAPKEGCFVYVADPTSNLHHFSVKWVSVCEEYIEYLQRGLVYLNKESSIARAKAMLITQEVK